MYFPATQRLRSFCASTTPCQELALKDLSDSLPTSVTNPTLKVLEQPPLPAAEPPELPQATVARAAITTRASARNPLISLLQIQAVVSRRYLREVLPQPTVSVQATIRAGRLAAGLRRGFIPPRPN